MRTLLAAVALLCALPVPAIAQTPLAGPGEPIALGRSYELPSRLLGDARRINVLLPDGYGDAESAQRRYPVLYLLDGGTGWQDFAHIAAMVFQGGLWGGNAPMIVVGIESRDRRAEFTRPSADPGEQKDFPTHGNAETFRRFLAQELKPAVDAAYRTNGTDGLIGESLAALFVVDTALRHGGDFDRYIAISPSLWWDGGRLSQDAPALLARTPQPPRTLWLSMADEGGTMQAGMDRVVAALKAHPTPALAWSYTPYPQEKHGTIYHPAAVRAVRDVFPAEKK